MKTFLLSFFPSFILLSTNVFAQTIPTEADIAAAKSECEKVYDPSTASATLKVSVLLAQKKCKLEVDIRVLQLKAKAESGKNEKIEAELKKQAAALEAATQRLAALEKAPKADSKPAPAPAKPTATDGAPAMGSPPVYSMGGAAFQIIETPCKNIATTSEIPGTQFSRVRVTSLWGGNSKWFNRNGPMKVIVFKNGSPIPVVRFVTTPNGHVTTVPIDEFYADVNGDGKPEMAPYQGVDPSLVDQVFVGDLQPTDTIVLVYLIPNGQFIAVNGLPPMPLWTSPKKIHFPVNYQTADRKLDAVAGFPSF